MNTEYFYGVVPRVFPLSFVSYPTRSGHSVEVFFTGCSHNCPGCQNPNLRAFGEVEQKISYDEFVEALKDSCRRNITDKVVLLGGDPLSYQNRFFVQRLLEDLSDEYKFCVYTGHSLNEIDKFVKKAEFVKCGRFLQIEYQEPAKTDEYLQFASKNQILYKREGISGFKKVSTEGRYYF